MTTQEHNQTLELNYAFLCGISYGISTCKTCAQELQKITGNDSIKFSDLWIFFDKVKARAEAQRTISPPHQHRAR